MTQDLWSHLDIFAFVEAIHRDTLALVRHDAIDAADRVGVPVVGTATPPLLPPFHSFRRALLGVGFQNVSGWRETTL